MASVSHGMWSKPIATCGNGGARIGDGTSLHDRNWGNVENMVRPGRPASDSRGARSECPEAKRNCFVWAVLGVGASCVNIHPRRRPGKAEQQPQGPARA